MNADLEQAPKVALQIERMLLRKASIERLGKLPNEASEDPTVNFQLNVIRPSEDGLGVELGLSLMHKEVLRAEVAYSGLFTRIQAAGMVSDEDLRYFAAKVAPSILYPYIRETIASLVVKTGLPPLVLPVLNFDGVFDPATIAIPPPGGAEA